MELSLDPPISSLADAAFELLRSQNWFDAILIIDDSTASDLLSYRMTRLCRKGKRVFPIHGTDPSNLWRADRYETRRQNWLQKVRGQEYRVRDSVWSRLKVIRLSKSMQQKEVKTPLLIIGIFNVVNMMNDTNKRPLFPHVFLSIDF